MAEINRLMSSEYDIRGRVSDEEVNENTVESIGKGFGTFLQRRDEQSKIEQIKDVVVGFDGGEYSERFRDSLVKGSLSTGSDVIDIGLCLSPVLYFSQYHMKIKSVEPIQILHQR